MFVTLSLIFFLAILNINVILKDSVYLNDCGGTFLTYVILNIAAGNTHAGVGLGQ